MKVKGLRFLVAAAFLMGLAATHAHAQTFNFASDVTPDSIAGSQGGSLSLIDRTTFQTATCDANLTPPGTDIVLLNLEVLSGADAGTPDEIGGGGAYDILLTLQNPVSLNTGSVHVTGTLTGSFSATTANVDNAFGALPGPIVIDGVTFSITQLVYAPPSPPGGLLGAVTAHVTCLEQPPIVPEPGSMALLFGAGFAGSGLAFRRLRRR